MACPKAEDRGRLLRRNENSVGRRRSRFAARPRPGPKSAPMTVFLAHAPADREAAEALEKFIERRGQFAELDDGHTALRPVQPSDVFVLLVSQALRCSPRRACGSNSARSTRGPTGRLVVVKLDHGIAPVGLRDLPAIDASFEAQREFKWNEVADAVRDALRAPPPPARCRATAIDERRASAAARAARSARSGGGVLGADRAAAADAAWPGRDRRDGVDLARRTASARRRARSPELLRGIDAFGARYGLPSGVTAMAVRCGDRADCCSCSRLLIARAVHARASRATELRRTMPRRRARRAREPPRNRCRVRLLRPRQRQRRAAA